jgi:hypothetical protein
MGPPRVHTLSFYVKMETEFIIALYLVIGISFVWWVLSILSFFLKTETAEPPSDIFIFLVQLVDSVHRRHPHVNTESLVQVFRIRFHRWFLKKKMLYVQYFTEVVHDSLPVSCLRMFIRIWHGLFVTDVWSQSAASRYHLIMIQSRPW